MKKIMFNDRYLLTQAVISGRKTQTRRIITPQPTFKDNCGICWEGYAYGLSISWDKLKGCCRNFVTGTEYDKSCKRLRKGEVVAVAQSYKDLGYPEFSLDISPKDYKVSRGTLGKSKGWKNKMFVRADLMPNHIRITDVRVERLHDISDEDCLKEGIYPYYYGDEKEKSFNEIPPNGYSFDGTDYHYPTPREAFAHLIDKISGKGTWDSNPYVWVYDFELIK